MIRGVKDSVSWQTRDISSASSNSVKDRRDTKLYVPGATLPVACCSAPTTSSIGTKLRQPRPELLIVIFPSKAAWRHISLTITLQPFTDSSAGAPNALDKRNTTQLGCCKAA